MDETRKFLEKFDSFLITGHLSLDGDAIGSELALFLYLKSIGKEALVVNDDPIPSNYHFLKGSEQALTLSEFRAKYRERNPFAAAVFIECSRKLRAGRTGRFVSRLPSLNIDHHSDNRRYGDANLVAVASACGEIIYELIAQNRGKITPAIASALYAAIMTDTGSFRFNASARTFQVVAGLVEKGAEPDKIYEAIYEKVSFATMQLLARVLSTLTRGYDGLVSYCWISRDMYRETGTTEDDSEGCIDYLRLIDKARVTFVLKELSNGRTRVNLRSKDKYDVQRVASVFNGGGHLNAAGCVVPAGIRETEKLLLAEIAKIIKD